VELAVRGGGPRRGRGAIGTSDLELFAPGAPLRSGPFRLASPGGPPVRVSTGFLFSRFFVGRLFERRSGLDFFLQAGPGTSSRLSMLGPSAGSAGDRLPQIQPVAAAFLVAPLEEGGPASRGLTAKRGKTVAPSHPTRQVERIAVRT